ncbi:MAG: hypothetical protein NT166_12375 [Candidatus Aminicenantes bacterium]|nr:hypothetical protein [Candidatus Aminicenantes bacterium]
MNRKITATIMLIIFMSVSFSCNSFYTKKVHLEEGKKQKLEHAKVFTVYTKSRQLIIFLKKTPAVVSAGNIVGFTEDNSGQIKLVSIPLSEAEVLWVKKWDAGGTFLNTFAGLGAIWVCLLGANLNH